jgi:drug/metabolite transporter (DMT)-like permease
MTGQTLQPGGGAWCGLVQADKPQCDDGGMSAIATSVGSPDKVRLSITCALVGSLAFSLNDVAVKSFTSTFPLHEVILFRALVALAFTLAVFSPGMRVADVFRTRRLGAHLFRGACVVLSNLTYFLALATLPLAETSAIFFIAPLLITALSAWLLREHVGAWRWMALAVGMAGVLLIVKPGAVSFQWAVVLPALSALAYAGMHMMTRRMGLAEPAVTMAVYIQLTFIAVCLAMGLVVGDGRFAGSGNHRWSSCSGPGYGRHRGTCSCSWRPAP